MIDWSIQRSGKIALVKYKREWRVCPVEDPERHYTYAGVFWYGGKTLKEATADAERFAWKNDLEFVGRLDKWLDAQAAA